MFCLSNLFCLSDSCLTGIDDEVSTTSSSDNTSAVGLLNYQTMTVQLPLMTDDYHTSAALAELYQLQPFHQQQVKSSNSTLAPECDTIDSGTVFHWRNMNMIASHLTFEASLVNISIGRPCMLIVRIELNSA